MKLVLSREAQRDFNEIDDFTTARWGSAQAESYLRDLRKAAGRLAGQPSLGRARADIPAPLLAYRAASHLIIYRVDLENDRIDILRILHQAMDIAGRLRDARQP